MEEEIRVSARSPFLSNSRRSRMAQKTALNSQGSLPELNIPLIMKREYSPPLVHLVPGLLHPFHQQSPVLLQRAARDRVQLQGVHLTGFLALDEFFNKV